MDRNIETRFVIENLLPEKFIYSLGLYLQTCAHMELLCSALCVCAAGKMPEEKDWYHLYCQNRKLPTKDLIKKLRRSAGELANKGSTEQIEQVCLWLDDYKGNRHAAAHGAFLGSSGSFIRLDHASNVGSKTDPKFEKWRQPITESLVEILLENANQGYNAISRILDSLSPNLVLRIYHEVAPIVEHKD